MNIRFKYSLFVILTITLIAPIAVKAANNAEIQAQIQSIMMQIKALQQRLSELQNQGSESRVWCHTFNTNLRIGDSGDEVSALQTALQKENFFISNDETERSGDASGTAFLVPATFGESTASAVTGFQEKYRSEILAPLGLKYGTGYAGKSTRAKLNKLYRCEVTPPPPPPVSTGYLQIEPSSASIKVGESVGMKAIYQPLMPKCDTPGISCVQVMPAPHQVNAEWASGNSDIVSVLASRVVCPQGGKTCASLQSVLAKGISNGTAEIKAVYTVPSSGVVLTATAKVTVESIKNIDKLYIEPANPYIRVGEQKTITAPKIVGIPAIPSSIRIEQSVSFSWDAADAEQDNLSWSVNWGDGTGFAGVCPSSEPNTSLTALHNWSKAGTYKVQVSVNDCRGGSDTHTFNVFVVYSGNTNNTSTLSD